MPISAFGYVGPKCIATEHATNQAYVSLQFERKLKDFTERGGMLSKPSTTRPMTRKQRLFTAMADMGRRHWPETLELCHLILCSFAAEEGLDTAHWS